MVIVRRFSPDTAGPLFVSDLTKSVVSEGYCTPVSFRFGHGWFTEWGGIYEGFLYGHTLVEKGKRRA